MKNHKDEDKTLAGKMNDTRIRLSCRRELKEEVVKMILDNFLVLALHVQMLQMY